MTKSKKNKNIQNQSIEGRGEFYVVATPIGNIEDITLRALRILKTVDIIFCEDTRQTGKLLSHYEIKANTQSYHARSSDSKVDTIISLLSEGKKIAYVTDSGTPGISDPSSSLVSEIRKQLPEVNIVAIPGPSALAAAISIAGVPVDEFVFIGFLPHKKGRETLLKEIAVSDRTFVFYESTHRIEKALSQLAKYMHDRGDSSEQAGQSGERPILIAREITKMFEEAILLTPTDHLARIKDDINKSKGEFVVIVPGLR